MITGISERDGFRELRSSGRWSRVDALRCLGSPNSQVAPPQVAIAIRREVGSAVVRNRIRRRLRHAITSVHRDDGLADGRYLVTVGSNSIPRNNSELMKMLKDLFQPFLATSGKKALI